MSLFQAGLRVVLRMGNARLVLVLLALTVAPAWAADKDKQPPPATPYSIFVYATPEMPGPANLADKSQKEIVDSANDVRKHITEKRKKWMRLVSKPDDAEMVLELKERQYSAGHGYVLEGHLMVFDMFDAKVIGQGGLNTEQIFNIWRDAAHDLAGRIEQYVLREKAASLEVARQQAARPWAARDLNEGDKKLDQGLLVDAIAAYTRGLAISPGSLRAVYNRGLAHSRANMHREAAADMGAAIALEPGNAKAHLHRGVARTNLKETDGALADLNEAIRLDPKLNAAFLGRARLHVDAKRWAEAIADLDAAEQLGSKDASLYWNRGLAYAGKAGETPAEAPQLLRSAVNDFNEVLARSPADNDALLQRAEAQARRGSHALAVDDYTKAINGGVRTAVALTNRGVCQARLGKTELAIADYTSAITADQASALAYWNRSQAYKKKGLTTRAAADRKKALELDPGVATRPDLF